MNAAWERSVALVEEWEGEVRRELPEGADVFDVHTHIGLDIDGMTGDVDVLLGIMDRHGISRAFTFCLDEPDRHPGFTAANDRTLASCARSGGRVLPFVRLDLAEGPIEEARRALDLGARGIKLHPRAQRFPLDDKRLEPIFALAAERAVPILIHGGRGLPPIAADLARLVERHPEAQLIIAHAGIADLTGLAGAMSGRAGVFFDTSTWSPIDLLELFRLVAPEQVMYASDYPYGQQPGSLLVALRTARAAGLTEEHVRGVLAGTADRIARGLPPLPCSAPEGSRTLVQPMVLARIHQYLSMAQPLLWTQQADRIGVLGLALNACEAGDGETAWELDRIRGLLAGVRDLWAHSAEIDDAAERRVITRQAYRLLHLADILAVTPAA